MEGTRWAAVHADAAAQHGAISLRRVVALGVPASTFLDHAARHGWVDLHQGVWAQPGSTDTYPRRAAAAQMALAAATLVTGRTTLWLAGVVQRPPDEVHLLLPPAHHVTRREGVRVFRGRPVSGDKGETLAGFDSTPVLRDMERRGRFPGIVALREALSAVGIDLGHSGVERRARVLLRCAGLDPHPRPLTVVEDGVLLGEVDIAFPDRRYGVEIDGPHHLLPEVIRADKARDRRLSRVGWRIDRFPFEEVETTPHLFVSAVRRGLAATPDPARW